MSWRLPPDSVLPAPDRRTVPVADLSVRLGAALDRLGIPARIVRTVPGPSTVAFELEPAESVRMRDFTRLQRKDDIAFAMGAESVRIQAPIPGKQLVGIEIPSPSRRVVSLSELLPVIAPPLTVGLGIATDGSPVSADIARLPHLLVAGETGSGKSSLLHAVLGSLLMRATPDDLRLVLVDPKRTELIRYAEIPHLLVPPVDDAGEAIRVLEGLVEEIERREALLLESGAQDVDEYNDRRPREKLPRVLCVVDEFAELMLTSGKRTETAVIRIAQLGRACGVHLILATQSPRVKIMTGLIKANIPARIALRVASVTDSGVAIDRKGAESLLGDGDALLLNGGRDQRFQTAFVPAVVIEDIVRRWRSQGAPKPPRPARASGPVPARVYVGEPPVAPLGAPEARPHAVRRRRAPFYRRRWRGILATVVSLFALYHLTTVPASYGCPSGTQYDATTSSETCDAPSGTTACVLSATGYTPDPSTAKPGVVFARKTSLGPWCANAHPPNGAGF